MKTSSLTALVAILVTATTIAKADPNKSTEVIIVSDGVLFADKLICKTFAVRDIAGTQTLSRGETASASIVGDVVKMSATLEGDLVSMFGNLKTKKFTFTISQPAGAGKKSDYYVVNSSELSSPKAIANLTFYLNGVSKNVFCTLQ